MHDSIYSIDRNKKRYICYNKPMKVNYNNSPYTFKKHLKSLIRGIFFFLSIIFGLACILGYTEQNRKNILLIFCLFCLCPFMLCLASYFKDFIRRHSGKKKATGILTEDARENATNVKLSDVKDIEETNNIKETLSCVSDIVSENLKCYEIKDTDEGKKREAIEENGVWWDRELVNKYTRSNPEFRYNEPFGRIFLESVWYVDGDNKESEVIEIMREIEKRGGRIHSDVSGRVTHYIGTVTKDTSGFFEKMAVKYGAGIITEEAFRDILSIADCTAERNRPLFTPSALFKVTGEALAMTEEEDMAKYIFAHKVGEGLVLTWLGGKEGKKTILWNGDNVEAFWNSIGEFLTSSIIVAINPVDDVIAPLIKKLFEIGIEVEFFKYIDLVRFCGTTLKHEDREQLKDIRYLTHLLGQMPPENDRELSDAVCAAFMVFIIDHDKPALEYISSYKPESKS